MLFSPAHSCQCLEILQLWQPERCYQHLLIVAKMLPAKDATRHLTMTEMTFKTKNYLTPNLNSAEIEKLCYRLWHNDKNQKPERGKYLAPRACCSLPRKALNRYEAHTHSHNYPSDRWAFNSWTGRIGKWFLDTPATIQFSHSVVSDSLWPHESQHTRPPCPSATPGVYSNSCPSSQ